MKWIREEEENIDKGIVNYKLPKYIEKKNKGLKTLNFSQIKDFLHIFVELDDDGSNSIEMGEILNHFWDTLTMKDVEDVFAERDNLGRILRDKNGWPAKLKQGINLEEYLRLMLPPENFFIPQYIIDITSPEYIEKLRWVKILKEGLGKHPDILIAEPRL